MTRHLKPRALLLLALVGAAPLLRSQCTPGNPTGCDIAPATLEINLGALPVDKYQDCKNWGGVTPDTPFIPSCNDPGHTKTVRACIQDILSSYRSQGATGVRFLFGLGGGGYSTPFSPSGQGLRPWLGKLDLFLKDVHDAGYTKVTPTPVLMAAWSAETSLFYTDPTGITGCSTDPPYPLRFLPWLPFGLEKKNGNDKLEMYSDCQNNNNGYKPPNSGGAAANTHNFWGWDKFFKLMDKVFQKVQANNLNIADFDLQNEMDLYHFTVEGRLIFDNTNQVDVLDGFPDPQYPWQRGIRGLMDAYFGTGAGSRVTFSTTMWRPAIPNPPPPQGIDCGSFYGDSALIIRESERLAAFGNEWVGKPAYLTMINGLPCQVNEHGEDGMIKLGVLPSQPTVTNIHAYPCFEDLCETRSNQGGDATLVAKNLYSGVWTYLQQRQMTGNRVMFGEVSPTHNSTTPCEVYWNDRAYDNVNGFMQSTLPGSQAGSNTVLRVWYNIQDPCYAQSGLPTIRPPYAQ